MAAHLIEPVSPTLAIARAWPCAALIDQAGAVCGATPALLFRRVCFHGHTRDLYLCNPHERGAARIGACGDCTGRRQGAHRCPVALILLPDAAGMIRAARR